MCAMVLHEHPAKEPKSLTAQAFQPVSRVGAGF
jgi:hypothetical protein